MKNEKGITLIMLMITVILLTVVMGIAFYEATENLENSKVINFETNMQVLQKKVDILIEERANYTILGSELTNEQKTSLETIMANDSNVKTNNSSETKLRYFSASQVEQVFDLSDFKDEIIVNFANREVISLNGIEKDGVMHYVVQGLH